MNRSEVITLLETIEAYYPHIKVENPKLRLEAFERALKSYDAETIHQNLLAYIELNTFPPTVSNLIRKQKGRAIPNFEETQAMLDARGSGKAASKETAETELAKIRAMLKGDE